MFTYTYIHTYQSICEYVCVYVNMHLYTLLAPVNVDYGGYSFFLLQLRQERKLCGSGLLYIYIYIYRSVYLLKEPTTGSDGF